MAVSEHQREENRARQLRQAERQRGRDAARDQAFDALDRLVAIGPPDWLPVEQEAVYDDELRRLRDRIGASAVTRAHRQSRAQQRY
jgi:hypothetical protein